MQQYSEDFKQSIIKKSLLPGGPSLRSIAIKNGLVLTTVYGWKRKYGNSASMKKTNKWTSEQKLQIIIESSSLPENELGEYIRKNGLHLAEIEEWKKECKLGMKEVGRPKMDPEIIDLRRDKKVLKADLKRKNTALAEMSARVILLKKSHSLFEEIEEDE